MGRYLSGFITLCLVLAITPAYANKALSEALIYHVYFGKAAAVQNLMDKGADPNTRDEHGWPALAAATDRNDSQAYPIAKILIDAGADVNASHNQNYPLLNAIKNNRAPLVALLVAADANLRIRSPEGVPVYNVAKKLNNPDIIYYLEKQLFEEAQTQSFLRSKRHLKQLTSQYAFHHCAFQYWGYYLRSKQDKNMDEEALKNKMRKHAAKASAIGERTLRYFPKVFEEKFNEVAANQRKHISQTLNEMISNRNRRVQGVGKPKDMLKRCHLKRTPAYFHAVALQ